MLYMKILGAIIAHLSNLYLLKSLNTKVGTHPDIDTRLKRVLKKGVVNEEPYDMYIHITLVIGIVVFLNMHNDQNLVEIRAKAPYLKFEQLESDLFALIEKVKS